MKGINFLTDENGQKTAVVIDIQTYGEQLQNFLDRLEAESRQSKSTENFDNTIDHVRTEKQDVGLVIDSAEAQNLKVKIMNEQLISLYNEFLPEINKQINNCVEKCKWGPDSVSKLFFMHVSDEYIKSKIKVMFVGSETHGWFQRQDTDNSFSLTNLYKSVSESETHFNSPFWWFRRDFSRAMGIEKDFMKSTLWTNLSKIDVGKEKPEGMEFGQLSQLFIKLLIAEVEVVKPDILLIMTIDGHYKWHLNNYNWILNEPFSITINPSGIERKSLPNSNVDRLVVNQLLPQNTFQFRHPNSLRYIKGGYTVHATDIIEIIKNNLIINQQ